MATKIKVHRVKEFIDGTFRDSAQPQYLRELVKNSIEAGAKDVVVGVEWGAVTKLPVPRYRLCVADNGRGMTTEELRKYMFSLGEGAKGTGGEHGNFGMGGRTSLLPWNRHGVIFVTYAKNPKTKKIEGAMAKLYFSSKDDDYCAFGYEVEDAEGFVTTEEIVDPSYNGRSNKEGITYENVLKTVFGKNFNGTGTAVICLGNTGREHTILNPRKLGIIAGGTGNEDDEASAAIDNADKSEGANVWMINQLNRRFYEFPEGVKVFVEAIQNKDKDFWPTKRDLQETKSATKLQRRLEVKRVMGQKHLLYKREKKNDRKEGVLSLRDGTKVEWCMLSQPTKGSQGGVGHGFIACVYRDELYGIQEGAGSHWRFKTFSILGVDLPKRLTIVLHPVDAGPNVAGVYPNRSRSQMIYRTADNVVLDDLPWNEWGVEFSRNMPEEVREENDKTLSGMVKGTWRDDDMKAYKSRWFGTVLSYLRGGVRLVVAAISGESGSHGGGTGATGSGEAGEASLKGSLKGELVPTGSVVRTPMPVVDKDRINWVDFSEREDLKPHEHCAAFLYNDGTLLFNSGWEIFKVHLGDVENYVMGHATHITDMEERRASALTMLREAYSRALYAKLCHTRGLGRTSGWSTATIHDKISDPEVLTVMLLGLIEEDMYVEQLCKPLGQKKTLKLASN